MSILKRCTMLALAGVLASACLSGCGGSSSSTNIPATVTTVYAHSVAFRNSTTLTVGYNGFGQLGNGDKKFATQTTGAPIPAFGRVNMVAPGGVHTLAAFTNNTTVRSCGSNYHGQLGVPSIATTGTQAFSNVPVTVHFPAGGKAVKGIAAGGFHSLAIVGSDTATPDGVVYGWGFNQYGQVGDDTLVDKNTPVAVKIATETNHTLGGIIQVAAGGSHSLALSSDGRVYAWGNNGGNNKDNVGNPVGGQLGIDPTSLNNAYLTAAGVVAGLPLPVLGNPDSPKVIQIAGGGSTSYALVSGTGTASSEWSVWSWGYNGMGQLGRPDTAGLNYVPAKVILPATPKVVKISAGLDHVLALMADGTVRAWGYNGFAQLGNDSTADSAVPVTVKNPAGNAALSGVTDIIAFGNHSLALVNGKWYGWGDNGFGELGNDISTTAIGYLLLPTLVRGF